MCLLGFDSISDFAPIVFVFLGGGRWGSCEVLAAVELYSFAIISLRKWALVALLQLCYCCHVVAAG